MTTSFDTQVTALGLVLPAPPKPVATYIPVVQADDLLFLSGMIPLRDGVLMTKGTLGKEVSVEEGYEAARICLLNALAVIRQHVGTLDRVKQIVRMVGYVASTQEFVQQPAVINGASDLLVKIFGDAGRHARVAIGAAALPLNAPVEIELIIQVSASSLSPSRS
jgi:enamine deaminase RidA (YjgF/YER057c/UK114 family)